MGLKSLILGLGIATSSVFSNQLYLHNYDGLVSHISEEKGGWPIAFQGSRVGAIQYVYENVSFSGNREYGYLYLPQDEVLIDITKGSFASRGKTFLLIDDDLFMDVATHRDQVVFYHTHPNDEIEEAKFRSLAETEEQKTFVDRYVQCVAIPSKEDIIVLKQQISLMQKQNLDILPFFGIISEQGVVHYGATKGFLEKFAAAQYEDLESKSLMETVNLVNAYGKVHLPYVQYINSYEARIWDELQYVDAPNDFVPHICNILSDGNLHFEFIPKSNIVSGKQKKE